MEERIEIDAITMKNIIFKKSKAAHMIQQFYSEEYLKEIKA